MGKTPFYIERCQPAMENSKWGRAALQLFPFARLTGRSFVRSVVVVVVISAYQVY